MSNIVKLLCVFAIVAALLFAATPAFAGNGNGNGGNKSPKPEKTEVVDPAEQTNPGNGNGHTDNGKNDSDPNGGGKNQDGSVDGNNGCGQEKHAGNGASDDNNGNGCKPKPTATPAPEETPTPTATPTTTPTVTPTATKAPDYTPGEVFTTTVPLDGPVQGPVVTTTVPFTGTSMTCPIVRDTKNVYIYVTMTPEPKRDITVSAGGNDADAGTYLPVSGGDADCPAIPWAQFGMVLLGAVLLSFVAGRKSVRH